MNMHGMKDEGFVLALLLLALPLDVSGLYISQNSSTKVTEDETFAVTCKDNVDRLPVAWRNAKGTILGPKTRPNVTTAYYGTSIIFAAPLRVEDTGNYTCFTEKDQRVFELFVEQPLEFKDTKTNQTGLEGADFVLKCEVRGGSVSWTVDGVAVTDQNSKFKVIGDGLLIRNVTRHDTKNYTCKGVQQRTGSVQDRTIAFHVKHKPIHPNHPHKHMRQEIVYSYINATVNLTCVALANPLAKFEWKVNNKAQKIGHIINEHPDVSILQLHIDNKAVFGNYKCIARNELGTYEENFTLKQGMRPEAPKNVQVKEAASKSVTLEIVGPDRTPEMELETRGFSVQYKKIDEEEWKQEEFNITKNHLYTLNNLEPKSKYQIQAATRNAAGLSDFFPSVTLTTSRAATVHLTSVFLCVVAIISFGNLNVAFW